MRVDDREFTDRAWRAHEFTSDFELEDVWRLPTPGGPDELPLLVGLLGSSGPPESEAGAIAGLLWAVRWRLGEWLGWDDEPTGAEDGWSSLRDRLPADLAALLTGAPLRDIPFQTIYSLPNEFLAEIRNRTVHGLLHLGWVSDGANPQGTHRARMSVLVRPRGRLGRAYMSGIKAFRLAIIYPELMARIERHWAARKGRVAPRDRPVAAVVGAELPPAEVRAAGLARVDYADRFSIATSDADPAQAWADTMLGDSSGALTGLIAGLLGQSTWQGSPGTLAGGWLRFATIEDNRVVLAADGANIDTRLVLSVDHRSVSLATLHRYHNRRGRLAWSALAPHHRRLAPPMLRKAVLEREPGILAGDAPR